MIENATTCTVVDAEVTGYYTGAYTWRIEDAKTKLHLEAPRTMNLSAPKFRVGPFTCCLDIDTALVENKWHLVPFVCINPEKFAAFGHCRFSLCDSERQLMELRTHKDHEFKKGVSVGFGTFMKVEDMLQQGFRSKEQDLYLTVQVYVKGVPVKKGVEATAPEAQLLRNLMDLKHAQIFENTQSQATTDAAASAEGSTLPSSSCFSSAAIDTLSFGRNGCVQVRMPLVATGEDRAQALEQNAACHQLLLKNSAKRFTWAPDLRLNDSSVVVQIERSLVQQLPLLQSLQNETVDTPLVQCEVAFQGQKGSQKKTKKTKKRTAAQMLAAQASEANDTIHSVPFKPNASICGIACVLMLLEGVTTPQQLFTCSCGPGLAVQTLWAASFLGHKTLEKAVTKWMHSVALCMLAGDDFAKSSEAPEDVKEIVGLLSKSEQDWHQVLGLLPADPLQTIFDDLMSMLPRDTLDSKVLKLPDACVDQWIDSWHGVLNLQSTTVPDVSLVLKLINRLPHHPELEVLHLPEVTEGDLSAQDIEQVLEALNLVLPALPKLRVLGLSSLQLRMKNMPEVASILSIVRDRLQGVAITIGSKLSSSYAEVAWILFQALRKMTHLQTLRLHRWNETITTEYVAGLKPLKVMLPRLPSSDYIDRMAAEAPGLKFCTVRAV